MSVLLALDLSTKCTGFAVFSLDTRELLEHGEIVPKVKGLTKLSYPEAPLLKILDMSQKIIELVKRVDPKLIAIEEVNRGISRIGQKTLDGAHYILLEKLYAEGRIPQVRYVDTITWRRGLGIKLTAEQKIANKAARKHNRRKGVEKKPILDAKHLAVALVNEAYGLNLEYSDNDRVEAIALGLYYLSTLVK